MNFKLFNDDTIIAPLKCGTRYMEKVFGDSSSRITSNDLKGRLFIKNLKVIVIREPMDHLISALHTVILRQVELDDRVKIKNILGEFVLFNETITKNVHWDMNMYEDLYWYWRRNRHNTDVINLNDLSPYIKQLNFTEVDYDFNDYNFNGSQLWCSKEDLMLFIKSNYEEEWEDLMEQINESNIFYNHLINKEVLEIKLI